MERNITKSGDRKQLIGSQGGKICRLSEILHIYSRVDSFHISRGFLV